MVSTVTIVVGAGSAGGALAARLSEDPEHHVMLLEAGPDYPTLEELPEDLRDPGEMSVQEHDWGIRAYYTEPSATGQELQPYPRGKVVGGSSCVNAAVSQRATVEDLERWVGLGNDEWSYDATLPDFKRVERDLDFPDAHHHGDSGPVPIRRHTTEELSGVAAAFLRTCVEDGHPACEDFNAPGSTGAGTATRNLMGDVRASALVTYLAQARGRPNLTLMPETTCLRVLFEGTRAVGVEVDRQGSIERLSADRVVLSAGALKSPQLLMLSGIGPQEVLDRFGIAPVHVNEGVGRHMTDHVFTPMIALLKGSTDKGGVRAQCKMTSPVGGHVDDITMWAAVFDPATINTAVDTRGRSAVTMVSLLAKPASEGWITLASADPRADPEVHCNYLGEQSDVARLMWSVRVAWDYVHRSPMSEEIQEVLFPTQEVIDDDAQLESFIRSVSTCSFHATSTCRMGPDSDPEAVVSQRLAVKGVEGLWVADASVMPVVPTALTNLTAYMIGERAAVLLREHAQTALERIGSPV